MKFSEVFTAIADGEIFQSEDIESISMAGGYCNMVVWPAREEKRKIKCKLKDVEFVSSGITPQKHVVHKTSYENCLGERKVDMEIVTPLEDIKWALVDALKTVKEEQQCNIEIKIDGKDFAMLIKKYNQDQARRSGGD